MGSEPNAQWYDHIGTCCAAAVGLCFARILSKIDASHEGMSCYCCGDATRWYAMWLEVAAEPNMNVPRAVSRQDFTTDN